jgi:GNAT superfamily N-acetyltransferase
VTLHAAAAAALAQAGAFLVAEPVLHNLLLTLLHGRVAHPDDGRYWVAADGGATAGVVFQSPLHFPAILSLMEPAVAVAMAEAIAAAGVALPGATGEAGTTARFAGAWTEVRKAGAVPIAGLRIYEVARVQGQAAARGRLRQAGPADRDLVVGWMRDFHDSIGEPESDPAPMVDRRLPAGLFWLWEDGQPASMAAHSLPVEGVVRVQAVYTPPEQRNHGYGGACVHALSTQIRAAGHRCILYTDLGNPTPNSVYRRIGYRAVAEALRYRFT